jgi:hypothetical protein
MKIENFITNKGIKELKNSLLKNPNLKEYDLSSFFFNF